MTVTETPPAATAAALSVVPVRPARAASRPRPATATRPGANQVWVDDPHPLTRRGMVSALASDRLLIVGESTGMSPLPDPARVGTLIFDADGPSAPAALRMGREHGTRLIAVLHTPSDARLHELVAAGVRAVLLHDDLTPQVLAEAVRAVAAGRSSMPVDILPRLLERAARVATSSPGSLTDRERAVLRLLAGGEDTRAIAAALCYSERTVKNVVHDILTKLNCRTRAQAVGLAIRAGVI
jgi:DNA-binding NarL/FixJ family response regulator